jgi:hypothetical protein
MCANFNEFVEPRAGGRAAPSIKQQITEAPHGYPLLNYCDSACRGNDIALELIMPGRSAHYLNEQIKQAIASPFGAEARP